jgi:hypothetical protein
VATSVSDLTFAVSPTIAINKTSGTQGSPVTVTGSGFAANESGINVTYDANQVASGIRATAKGAWSVTFNVPASAGGPHVVDASGTSTQANNIEDLTFTTGSSIALNRTSGPTGTPITVTGSGFAPSETPITVTYDSAQVASGITANAQGGWSATFNIPASPAGSHIIDASGPTTQPPAWLI